VGCSSILGFVSVARAECAAGDGPWVAVSFADNRWSDQFKNNVLADFRARLAEEGIAVCAKQEAPARAAVAEVTISPQGSASVDVSVDLSDSLTAKRVGRDVDLSRVPPDGRPLAVALAAGELLRASWVEIALNQPRAAAPPRPPPPEVRRVVQRALPVAESPAHPPRVGLLAAGEHFAGGQTQLGVDAYFIGILASRLRLSMAGGGREGLSVRSKYGEVLGSSLGIALGGQVVVAESARRAELALGLGVRFAVARFRGRAGEGATENDFSGLSIYARLGLDAAFCLVGPLWLEAGAGGGLPLRSLSATDDTTTLTGMTGLELAGRAGLGVAF
jgi:hypothetical protein